MAKFNRALITLLIVCGFVNTTLAQHLIQGKLIDSNTGQPVPYASVLIKGTAIGTISNDNGEFAVSSTALPATLKIAHLSYQGMEVDITDDKPLQLKLTEATNTLTEVKVGNPALSIIKSAAQKAYKQANIVHLAKAFSRQMLISGNEAAYFTESFFDAQWQNWGLTKSKITNARYLEKTGAINYTNINFFASTSSGFVKNSIVITPIARTPDSLYTFKIKETIKNNGKEIIVINSVKGHRKNQLSLCG